MCVPLTAAASTSLRLSSTARFAKSANDSPSIRGKVNDADIACSTCQFIRPVFCGPAPDMIVVTDGNAPTLRADRRSPWHDLPDAK